MKDHFQLQFKMINRKIAAFGLPLFIGYTILPIVFILLSNFLFSKIELASYLYGVAALSLSSKLSEPKRNDFLKLIFSTKKYRELRIVENLVVILPFILFLIYKRVFIPTLALIIITIILTLINFNTNLNFTLPTPFSKKPFEFLVGFRKTFYLFLIAYFLTFMALYVDNFNLAIFSLLLIGLICMSYYSKLENDYFIWSFNLSPKQFLLEKIKTCFIYFSLLSIPTLILLTIFFFKDLNILLGFLILCYVYLTTLIFAKYSVFPNEMSLPQGIILSICFIFPPVLIAVIPYFYSQSIKRLKTIL